MLVSRISTHNLGKRATPISSMKQEMGGSKHRGNSQDLIGRFFSRRAGLGQDPLITHNLLDYSLLQQVC